VKRKKYYRHMFEGGEITWNIRDTHMCDCLQDLIQHNGSETKVIIWVIRIFLLSKRFSVFSR
jgi:erythromycin esterase-like protein